MATQRTAHELYQLVLNQEDHVRKTFEGAGTVVYASMPKEQKVIFVFLDEHDELLNAYSAPYAGPGQSSRKVIHTLRDFYLVMFYIRFVEDIWAGLNAQTSKDLHCALLMEQLYEQMTGNNLHAELRKDNYYRRRPLMRFTNKFWDIPQFVTTARYDREYYYYPDTKLMVAVYKFYRYPSDRVRSLRRGNHAEGSTAAFIPPADYRSDWREVLQITEHLKGPKVPYLNAIFHAHQRMIEAFYDIPPNTKYKE